MAAAPLLGASMPTAADQYFSGELGLVGTFDFDYEKIIKYEKELRWAGLIFMGPPAWLSCICCLPCYLNQNIEWEARARHVALTVDGVRYVTEKRKSCCGFPCSDKGKESKTVPYDKITDCDVQEPAGTACCCCVQRVLSTVLLDTASSGATAEGGVRHELSLSGMKFPSEFKQAVWGMKRSQASVQPQLPAAMQPSQLAAPRQAQMHEPLLIEIRDELRQMNALLKSQTAEES